MGEPNGLSIKALMGGDIITVVGTKDDITALVADAIQGIRLDPYESKERDSRRMIYGNLLTLIDRAAEPGKEVR